MNRSYISSPPQAPSWRVAGLLYFKWVKFDFWSVLKYERSFNSEAQNCVLGRTAV
jgi:hypothetical protein